MIAIKVETEDKKYFPVKHLNSNSYDLFINMELTIIGNKLIQNFNVINNKLILYPGAIVGLNTGIKIEPPVGVSAKVRSRSSSALKGLFFPTGTIDTDYRGYIYITAYNLSDKEIIISDGDKLAQIEFIRDLDTTLKEEKVNVTERGENGFGSSDINVINKQFNKDTLFIILNKEDTTLGDIKRTIRNIEDDYKILGIVFLYQIIEKENIILNNFKNAYPDKTIRLYSKIPIFESEKYSTTELDKNINYFKLQGTIIVV